MRKYSCLERLYYFIFECKDIVNERKIWVKNKLELK